MDSNTKKMLWNMAGTAGLLMGLISTGNMFISQAMSTAQMPAFAVSVYMTTANTAKRRCLNHATASLWLLRRRITAKPWRFRLFRRACTDTPRIKP